jgi:hypothetical protein
LHDIDLSIMLTYVLQALSLVVSGCAEGVYVTCYRWNFGPECGPVLFYAADGGPVSTKLIWSHLSSVSLSRQYVKIFVCFLSLWFLRHRAAAAAHLPPPSRTTPRLRRSELPFPHESRRNLRSHIPPPLPTTSLKPPPPSSAPTRLRHLLHSDQPRHMLRR